jgi:hypothetical protein
MRQFITHSMHIYNNINYTKSIEREIAATVILPFFSVAIFDSLYTGTVL